jgi:D-alanyl-lipoteichoic acid acyltransferase DltB (MBOAT superfamily)
MLFVTDTFLLYFLTVFFVYWILPFRYRVNFLTIASIFFYATWSVAFTIHFLAVITINYYVMELWRRRPRRWIFFTLQAANVMNISVFKYYYLFADFLGLLTGLDEWRAPALRESHRILGHEILLPLAISFYTFQIMSYGIDIYRGVYTERHSLRNVVLFKAFFPQLIAGPIMRSSDLLPQIERCDHDGFEPDRDLMRRGLWLVLIGIVKKMMIADYLLVQLAPVLSADVTSISSYDPVHLWIVIVGALFMLYADFSAYSDMARGFGFMLGFSIPENFRAPFFMKSISDFWRRWHLTFSQWIRDYIFIPLGGSRVREGRLFFNLIFTFFIGGLWHGASYTFVMWGAITGILLSIEAFLFSRGVEEWPASLWKRGVKLLITYALFIPTTAFFFGPDLEWTMQTVIRMFQLMDAGLPGLIRFGGAQSVGYAAGALLLFHLIEERPIYFERIRRHEKWLLPVLSIVVIFAITQFGGGKKDFFYFQF